MYLHEDRENFKEIIEQVSDAIGRTPMVIEKDYYVTLILKLLAEKISNCVFKGGTSLSKGFQVIDRFSEDIDITFDEHIGDYLKEKGHEDIVEKYQLTEFSMKLLSATAQIYV